MASLAERGIDPDVVDDQVGRLTFTADIARGIRHLLETEAPYGVYNLTGGGDPHDRGRTSPDACSSSLGHDPARVTPVSTDEYFAGAEPAVAPRPRNSVLDLTRIEATGFEAEPAGASLEKYLSALSGS